VNANNLWEKDRLRKLTTVAAVEAEIARCEFGQRGAPSAAKVKDWGRKLVWLDRLKRELTTRPAT